MILLGLRTVTYTAMAISHFFACSYRWSQQNRLYKKALSLDKGSFTGFPHLIRSAAFAMRADFFLLPCCCIADVLINDCSAGSSGEWATQVSTALYLKLI